YEVVVRHRKIHKGDSSCADTGAADQPPINTPPYCTKNGANTRLRMADSLIRIFSDGPEVSLRGSPTVSPTTAALCSSDPLPPWLPASMYFLALSQAPPLLDEEIASTPPATSEPARMPATAGTPNRKPATSGVPMIRTPGAIISRSAALVEIATHWA